MRIDFRTLLTMLAATLLGVAGAAYALEASAGERSIAVLRLLIWVICATPLLLGLGWLLARRGEAWLAGFCCLSLYIFTPFVARRIEQLFDPARAAVIGGDHTTYFMAVIGIHLLGGIGLAIWRAAAPPSPLTSALQ
jgi:hypothetical protein